MDETIECRLHVHDGFYSTCFVFESNRNPHLLLSDKANKPFHVPFVE